MKMIINRYNYETYFLLYIDKELCAEEMLAVETFVAAHPDLKAELELLQQAVIRPEKQASFPDKTILMKFAVQSSFINDGNDEEYFILYADNELSMSERLAVEQYVSAHPERKHDFETFQQIKLQPGQLACDFKNSLYKREAGRKVIPFRWRIAAAAAVLILAGWFWLNKDGAPSETMIVREDSSVERRTKGPVPAETQTHGAGQLAADGGTDEHAGIPNEPLMIKDNGSKAAAVTRSGSARVATVVRPRSAPGKALQTGASANTPDKQPGIKSLISTDEIKPVVKDLATIISEQPVKDVAVSAATPGNDQEENNSISFASQNKSENVFLTNIPVDNNARLRSFLRKASRVVNKVTALKQGNRSGILIGNVEIAIQ